MRIGSQEAIPLIINPLSLPTKRQRVGGGAYLTSSNLVAADAPSFPRLSQFFNWLWDKLCSLLPFLFSKKKPQEQIPPSLDADILAILGKPKEPQTTPIEEPLPPSRSIGKKSQQLVIEGVLAWSLGGLPMFLQTQATEGATAALEKISERIFPSISENWRKAGSLAIGFTGVWYTSNQYGYPTGWVPPAARTMQVISLAAQVQLSSLLNSLLPQANR